MNTTANAQTISRILNASGIRKSESHKSGIKRQGNRSSEGYKVSKNWNDEIEIRYVQRTNSFLTFAEFKPTYDAAIASIEATLIAKGYTIESNANGLVVKAA